MTLERRNPLPPGRYWLDVPPGNLPAWSEFLARGVGLVRIEAQETVPSGGSATSVLWALFSTQAPLAWNAAALGFPTIAGPEIRRREDTVQRPVETGVGDEIEAALGEVSGAVKLVAAIGIGWLALKAIQELRR